MKKFTVFGGLVAVALLLGIAGNAVRVEQAKATPTEVLTIAPNICIALTADADWVVDNPAGDLDGDGDVDGTDNAIFACSPIVAGGLMAPFNLAAIAAGLGADTVALDGVAEPWVACANAVDDDADGTVDDGCAEFDPATGNAAWADPDIWAPLAEAGGNQLIEDEGAAVPPLPWGQLWVLSFVSNDDFIGYVADEGVWTFPIAPNSSSIDCQDVAGPQTFVEPDCDDDGVPFDKMVVTMIEGNGVADRGDWELVVSQSGVDFILDYVVVGEPDELDMELVGGDTIQEGLSEGDCEDLDVADFSDEIGAPEVTGVLGTVTDDDGTALAGIFVDYTSDDEDVANVNLDTSISVVAGEDVIVSPNLICGDSPGEAEIEGQIDPPGIDDTVDVTVIGAPDAMTLTASPAMITCDGVSSSTVAAAIVDSEGNPVVAGVPVRFDVVALGTSDPIVTETDETGSASSKITPLSGVSAGVVVLVTAFTGDDFLEGSIRVDCAPPAPPVQPPPATPVPPVKPPVTGDAGLLP